MKTLTLFVLVGLLAIAAGDPEPVPAPVPDPVPDPDPKADPVAVADADPEHYKPNAQAYNPRRQRIQAGQQSPYYPPPQGFQQPSQYPPQPYQQIQPNPYPQQPYYPTYPYPQPTQGQQKPGRRGRVLDTQSNLNAVAPPPQFFTAPAGAQPQTGDDDAYADTGSQEKKNNKRYPLTPPLLKFKIGTVSDLDQGTKIEGGREDEFQSILRQGFLYLQQNPNDPSETNVTIEWNDTSTKQIKSGFNYAGRGMELSTLNAFEGKLYSCDDHTGIVFEIPISTNESESIVPEPWVILADGNSTGPKGFKCEWATTKDGDLWVGGHGVNTLDEKGDIKDKNGKFVKRITPEGEVTHLDWTKNYDKIGEALEINFPGYVTHEAVSWSDDLQKWLFMPQQVSKDPYIEGEDRGYGSNVVLIADEEFGDIQVGRIGEVIPDRGFSGMKFIPGTADQMIVALRTTKSQNGDETFIMAFDLKGNMLLNETKFADQKYQGLEFL